MSTSPKIVVVKMREIIYTLLLIFLVALLIVCLVLMFSPKRDGHAGQTPSSQTQTNQAQNGQTPSSQTQTSQAQNGQTPSSQTQTSQAQNGQTQTNQTQSDTAAPTSASVSVYIPGVYTTPVNLGESTIDVEVTADSDRITSIRIVNLSETVSAAFPLLSPTLDHLAAQILETQKLDGITCPSKNKYTAQLLYAAISDAVARAAGTD